MIVKSLNSTCYLWEFTSSFFFLRCWTRCIINIRSLLAFGTLRFLLLYLFIYLSTRTIFASFCGAVEINKIKKKNDEEICRSPRSKKTFKVHVNHVNLFIRKLNQEFYCIKWHFASFPFVWDDENVKIKKKYENK